MKTIGVLGLGIIGSVWARHYQAAGVLAGAWNRTPHPDFPHWKTTPLAVAQAVDIVQIVVADPPAVRALLAQILPALGPGKTVVQSSTIDPRSSEEFYQAVTARGARYLEAPFTGSKPAAEQKQVVYYVGGDVATVADMDAMLGLVSLVRIPIGDHQQATALKLAMNLNIAAQMEALSEAITLVRRAGISDDVFFGALARNASQGYAFGGGYRRVRSVPCFRYDARPVGGGGSGGIGRSRFLGSRHATKSKIKLKGGTNSVGISPGVPRGPLAGAEGAYSILSGASFWSAGRFFFSKYFLSTDPATGAA